MYIKDGIAYAGDEPKLLSVISIRPLDNYKLWIRFNNNEVKIFDFNKLLKRPVFSCLKDKKLFDSVYIDYGVPVWQEGAIDIAPEYLYDNSEKANN